MRLGANTKYLNWGAIIGSSYMVNALFICINLVTLVHICLRIFLSLVPTSFCSPSSFPTLSLTHILSSGLDNTTPVVTNSHVSLRLFFYKAAFSSARPDTLTGIGIFQNEGTDCKSQFLLAASSSLSLSALPSSPSVCLEIIRLV